MVGRCLLLTSVGHSVIAVAEALPDLSKFAGFTGLGIRGVGVGEKDIVCGGPRTLTQLVVYAGAVFSIVVEFRRNSL